MNKKRVSNTDTVNMAHVREEKQRETMERSVRDGVCIFCKEHLHKYHTLPILKQNRSWLVTENQFPYEGTRAHLLFINKRHIRHLSEVHREEWADLAPLVRWVNKQYGIDGGALFFRFGDTNLTSATISHLHGHIITGEHQHSANASLKVSLGYKK